MSSRGNALPTSARAEPRLLEGRILRGCNVHHRSTVFTQRVDLRGLAGRGTGDAGVPFEQALLEAILEVERAVAGTMLSSDGPAFATIVRDPSSSRVVDLVWESRSGGVSRAAARVALAGLLALTAAGIRPSAPDREGHFGALRAKLERRARRRRWSPAAAALAFAARRRGIPCEPLAGSYLRLGEGALQRVVSASDPADAADSILETVFPSGATALLPTALIVGERGTGAVGRSLEGLLRASGSAVGLATRQETTVSGKPVDRNAHGRGAGARFLLGDPRVEKLVCALSPRTIVARGLRLDHASVAAVLEPKGGGDPAEYRLGIDVAVAATSGAVIVGAENPHAQRLLEEIGPQRVVLVAARRRAVQPHLSQGGCAVVLTRSARGETLDLIRSSETLASVKVASLRSRTRGVGDRRLRRTMFAIGLAFGLGLSGVELSSAVEKSQYLRR